MENKVFTIATVRDLESQVSEQEISYSRMVELMNEQAEAFTKSFAEWIDKNNFSVYSHAKRGFITGELLKKFKEENNK